MTYPRGTTPPTNQRSRGQRAARRRSTSPSRGTGRVGYRRPGDHDDKGHILTAGAESKGKTDLPKTLNGRAKATNGHGLQRLPEAELDRLIREGDDLVGSE